MPIVAKNTFSKTIGHYYEDENLFTL